MKKILITGANSFVGTSFEKWCQKLPEQYETTSIDLKSDGWRNTSFSGYDTVFHVAGIAHVSKNPQMEHLYYKVNRDLAIEVAQKSKADGVIQFIFMSSIIVYGESQNLNEKRIITRQTVPTPGNYYGNSKLQAEVGIAQLEDETFKIAILRPPMIYGKGSKGNYPKLAMLARKLPIFPKIDNERSMLYIDNLCEFVRLIIENGDNGLFFPQNQEYVSTSEMVRVIAEAHGKNVRMTKIFNSVIGLMSRKFAIIGKAFGNLTYEKGMSLYRTEYRICTFKQSIIITEKR